MASAPDFSQGLKLNQMTGSKAETTENLLKDIGNLRGKVILITGGASGLGKAFCLEAGKHGAKLVIGDLNEEGARSVADQIKKEGGEAVSGRCDVTDFKSQVQLFNLARKTYKHIDVCIPCAGLGEVDQLENELKKGADGEYEEPRMLQLKVNLIGVMYSVQLGLSHLKQNPSKDKAIVLIASIAGYMGLPMGSIYCAAKHGVMGLFKSLPPQAAVENIRVSVIAPFFVDTPILTYATKILLKDLPLAKIEDVVSSLLCTASSPSAAGRSYIIDPSGVYSSPWNATVEETNNVYHAIALRAEAILGVMGTFRSLDRALSPIGGIKAGLVAAIAIPAVMYFR